MELQSSKEFPVKSNSSDVTVQETNVGEEESEDVEIGNFFSEDSPLNEGLSPEIHKLQKKEKLREMLSENNLEKLSGIWKKVVYAMTCQINPPSPTTQMHTCTHLLFSHVNMRVIYAEMFSEITPHICLRVL